MKKIIMRSNVINNISPDEKGNFEAFVSLFMKKTNVQKITFGEVIKFDSTTHISGKKTALYRQVITKIKNRVIQKPEMA
jgi:hypothetical protein